MNLQVASVHNVIVVAIDAKKVGERYIVKSHGGRDGVSLQI
jgi:hypothetical protein